MRLRQNMKKCEDCSCNEKYSTAEIKELMEGLVEVWRDWARASWAMRYDNFDKKTGDLVRIAVVDYEGNEIRSWSKDDDDWDADVASDEADEYVAKEIEDACRDYSELWGDSDEARLYHALEEISETNQDGDELLDYEQKVIQEARDIVN